MPLCRALPSFLPPHWLGGIRSFAELGRRAIRIAPLALLAVLAAGLAPRPLLAQEPAKSGTSTNAADPPGATRSLTPAPTEASPATPQRPGLQMLTVAVLTSSRTDRCFDDGNIKAIKTLTQQEVERINRSGDLGRRRLALRFLDDQRDAQKLIANMRTALGDASTVAVLGLANSANAKALFDAAAPEIRDSGAPFISDLSVSSLFAELGNVFTTRSAQETENIPLLLNFLKDLGVQKPAFIGLKDQVFSKVLGDTLKGGNGPALVADHRLSLAGNQLVPEEVTTAIRDAKSKDADFLFLSVGSQRAAAVFRQMLAAGFRPPVFVSGRIDSILSSSAQFNYANDIYQLAWDGLPDAYNDRLRQRIQKSNPKDWQFEGARVEQAPGWKTGECKPRPPTYDAGTFETPNLRAIEVGTQYGDMIGLLGEIIQSIPEGSNVRTVRSHIVEQLQTRYAEGRGAFRGNFDTWSFNPQTRAASRPPLLVMLRNGQKTLQLAPYQYVRLRDEVLRPVETLYLDIDMLRTYRIDDNEKSFFAEFLLLLHHEKGAGIERIEFANAFLDPKTGEKQLSVRALHEGGRSVTYPENMKVYRVNGRFMFEPKLGNYPFDTQRFSIDLQPKMGEHPFIIQPPPLKLRDQKVEADGWDIVEQFVSYDEDFVRLIDAKTHEQNVVPFYKGSFVWMMRRLAIDYYLRVVVPLGFILVVAYLSIFIPRTHFEAVVTIQVTALLSAVALYLALPKLDSDTATFSDRIFLFVYLAVSVMIAISIARVNPLMKGRAVPRTLAMLHIVGIPLMVVAMAIVLASASQSDGHSWTVALDAWKGKVAKMWDF